MATYQKVNTGTGFRSGSGGLGSGNLVDVDYENPFDIETRLPPPPPPVDDGGSDSSSVIPGRPDSASNTALSYVDDYNNSINTFGSDGGMMQANIDNPVANPTDFYGNPIPKEVYGPTFDARMLIPGGSFMGFNDPAIPTSGYGTPGTYSSLSGGRFNADSQAVDPITGQPIAEYGTKGAFLQSLKDDPFSNTTSPQGNLNDMQYAASRSELAGPAYGTTDSMGNPTNTGLSPLAKQRVAQQLGQNMGFESYTVAPGTATNEAIANQSVVAGSQYSPTGTFTTEADQAKFNNMDNFSYPNATNFSTVDYSKADKQREDAKTQREADAIAAQEAQAAAEAQQRAEAQQAIEAQQRAEEERAQKAREEQARAEAKAKAAADAEAARVAEAARRARDLQSNNEGPKENKGGRSTDMNYSDFGGGGGGGGGGSSCVIATHGISTGAFTLMEKAKAELWCQKKYHDKWYGEAFRRGYRAVGMRHVNNGTAPSVYQEFKNFVAYGRGIKKDWKSAINYYYRTITFFVIGLFIGDK